MYMSDLACFRNVKPNRLPPFSEAVSQGEGGSSYCISGVLRMTMALTYSTQKRHYRMFPVQVSFRYQGYKRVMVGMYASRNVP